MWYEKAEEKLENAGSEGKYGRAAECMKEYIKSALLDFCRQNEEFAQAVAQGGAFADCMAAVEDKCGSAISDLDACKRAVQFYFPGADVAFHMTVELCSADEETGEKPGGIVIDLSEFF